MTAKMIRIGCGAGYSGDRIEPAVELAEKGALDYLVFECLAERTIALAQQARAKDPDAGYDPLLIERMKAVLPAAAARGIRIITNMGAANPLAAARVVRDLAGSLGLRGLTVAAVTGDDVFHEVQSGDDIVSETGQPVRSLGTALVSANAYIGAGPIAEALGTGARVVIAGRVADPSMFVAAAVHTFGWPLDAWTLIGRGTVAGHLLECAGQVTGGYFADPGYSDVDALARLGFPIAELSDDGSTVITKVQGSGGRVTEATCKQQLVYELHDPRAYVTPDVVADFSRVHVRELASDRVVVEGADGRARTTTLKVALGYADGFIGEGQISYAGPGAVQRARLAQAVVTARLHDTGVRYDELRADLIGVDALHGDRLSAGRSSGLEPYEVRLRVAARTRTRQDAVRIGNEVETLYTNGPAAGGGVTKSVRDVLAMASTLMPRDRVHCRVHVEVV